MNACPICGAMELVDDHGLAATESPLFCAAHIELMKTERRRLLDGSACLAIRQEHADQLYEAIKHGDDAHRKWLRDKLDEWARGDVVLPNKKPQ